MKKILLLLSLLYLIALNSPIFGQDENEDYGNQSHSNDEECTGEYNQNTTFFGTVHAKYNDKRTAIILTFSPTSEEIESNAKSFAAMVNDKIKIEFLCTMAGPKMIYGPYKFVNKTITIPVSHKKVIERLMYAIEFQGSFKKSSDKRIYKNAKSSMKVPGWSCRE